MAMLLALVVVTAVACGGGKQEAQAAVYFLEGYLAPLGYRGQLLAVDRDARSPRTVLAALLRGPTAAERRRGLISTISRGTRVRSVWIAHGTATVELAGVRPRDFYSAAQFVYSLAALPGVHWVRLRFDRKSCCFYTHSGAVVARVRPQEASFRYWQGEPCALRTSPDQARCRRKSLLVPGRFERPGLEADIESAGPIRGGTRPDASCAGEGALVDGVRFYDCVLTWPRGTTRRRCVGAAATGGLAYLPVRRC